LRQFTPKYRAYDLRHTHATLLLRKGVNPKVISERLGHWDVGFTLSTYAASMADMQEEAAQQMEAILSVVG
jgi:integrase